MKEEFIKFLIYVVVSLILLLTSAYFVKNFTLFMILHLCYMLPLAGIGHLKIPRKVANNITYFMFIYIPIMAVISLMVGLKV